MYPENIINLVINQTNYNRELAIEKLNHWNGNHIHVIKDYLNPNFQMKKKEKPKTNNQKIMSAVRTYMDNISVNYYKRKKKKEEEMHQKQMMKEAKQKEKELQNQIELEKSIKKKLKDDKEKELLEKERFENENDGLIIKEI